MPRIRASDYEPSVELISYYRLLALICALASMGDICE